MHAMPCLNLHAAGPAPHIVPAPCLLTTQAPAVAQPKLPKLGDVGEDAGDFRIYYESRVDPQAPCIVLQLYTCSLTYNPTSHDPTPGPVQCGTTVRGRIGGSYVSADAANAEVRQHVAALQEEKHAFEDYFQPSTDPGGLLYTAKLGDAGEGTQEEIEVWVTKGAKEDWVQHWDEEELAELSYNPPSWEDVPVLKGGGTASCGSAGRAAAAAAGSTSTSGGLLPSQDLGLWRALLTATGGASPA